MAFRSDHRRNIEALRERARRLKEAEAKKSLNKTLSHVESSSGGRVVNNYTIQAHAADQIMSQEMSQTMARRLRQIDLAPLERRVAASMGAQAMLGPLAPTERVEGFYARALAEIDAAEPERLLQSFHRYGFVSETGRQHVPRPVIPNVDETSGHMNWSVATPETVGDDTFRTLGAYSFVGYSDSTGAAMYSSAIRYLTEWAERAWLTRDTSNFAATAVILRDPIGQRPNSPFYFRNRLRAEMRKSVQSGQGRSATISLYLQSFKTDSAVLGSPVGAPVRLIDLAVISGMSQTYDRYTPQEILEPFLYELPIVCDQLREAGYML